MVYLLFILLLICSCTREQQVDNSYLEAVNSYISFPLDDETRLPQYCFWYFIDNGKDFIAFPNDQNQILFYDMTSREILKKVQFAIEGINGVGNIHSFSIVDFGHIYIADMNRPIIYETDTTGQIRSKIIFNKTSDGKPLIPAESYINSPIISFADSLFVPQYRNRMLGENSLKQSPRGIIIDKNTNEIVATPLNHILPVDNIADARYLTAGDIGSVCFDGRNLIFSYELIDTVYKLSMDFSTINKYSIKSKYTKKAKYEVLRNVDFNQKMKRVCELPVYGNIIYDKYREVYYRFTFPEVSFDMKENFLDIFHYGKKIFSIIILDNDMHKIGETIFPEFTFNSNLYFIKEDGLYLNVNHIKSVNFKEDTLKFQKVILKKKGNNSQK